MNKVLDKFQNGETSIGTFSHLMSECAIEAMGTTGLDYVIIDMEHSPMGTDTAAKMITASKAADLVPFVRVDEACRSSVLKMLDVGAMGLVIPNIHNVEQVKELVKWAKFKPIGDRGYCPTRDALWGTASVMDKGLAHYMATANKEALLFPQCETTGALENIEEIVALEGVDGIFIGPFDLSISMGIAGQFEHPDFKAAIKKVLDTCKKNNKICIMFAGSAEAARGYIKDGYDSVGVGLDIMMLMSAYTGLVSEIKK